MFNKLIKIGVLYYLLASNNCFSQIKTGNFDGTVTSEYNDYLTAVHLKQLIKATNFSYQNEISHNGSQGQVTLKSIYVLTIESKPAFSDPINFEGTWENTVETLNGKASVYWQLFFKLVDLTQLPPDSLVILIKTNKPDLVSYMIYFDKGIQFNEADIGIKGSSDFNTANVNPGDLNNVLYNWVFPKVPYNTKIKDSLTEKISRFLKDNGHGQINHSINITPVHRAENIIFFEARNLIGRVTNERYFEDITITLTIIPVSSSKIDSASVGYSWSVFYSSRRFNGPASPENAENAIARHKTEMLAYGNSLYKLFINTIYGANN